jgi:NAD(P)H-dependent FMN reductase
MSPMTPIRMLGICGSLRTASYTRQALVIALAGAQRQGAETKLCSSEEITLPLCDGRDEDLDPHVLHLRDQVHHADALLIGSPEYCGTFSAALKNVIEWLNPDLLMGKVIGVLAVAEGASAQGAFSGLQQICLLQGAWVLPFGVAVPFAQTTFTQPERPFAQQTMRQLDLLGVHLIEAAQRLRKKES